MILYVVRAVAYEIPYYGGRARGQRRPRAPSLVERPNGKRRTISFSAAADSSSVDDEKDEFSRRSRDRSTHDEAVGSSEED